MCFVEASYQLWAGGKGVLGLREAIPAAKTCILKGAEFVALFVPVGSEFVVQGRSDGSIFSNSNLTAYLRNNKIDTLIMMGFATYHRCQRGIQQRAGYPLRQTHSSSFWRGYHSRTACGVSGAIW